MESQRSQECFLIENVINNGVCGNHKGGRLITSWIRQSRATSQVSRMVEAGNTIGRNVRNGVQNAECFKRFGSE